MSLPNVTDISRYIQACRASTRYGLPINLRYIYKRVWALVCRQSFRLAWLWGLRVCCVSDDYCDFFALHSVICPTGPPRNILRNSEGLFGILSDSFGYSNHLRCTSQIMFLNCNCNWLWEDPELHWSLIILLTCFWFWFSCLNIPASRNLTSEDENPICKW